jgi:phospho-N-acetylmuramoyl-pentapeptide-transferase
MFYKLLYAMHEAFSPLNVFRYITFRTALAVLTAAAFTIILTPRITRWLRERSVTQSIRVDGPKTHMGKQGTPTMGGLVIIMAVMLAMVLWGDLSNIYVLIACAGLVAFGAIGFADDYLKVTRRNSKGLSARYKLLWQGLAALAIGLVLYHNPADAHPDRLILPFFKGAFLKLGLLYIPFAILVIVGSSNAVNLTDGMDGLAIGLVAIATLANGALVYISGHKGLAEYLQVLYLPTTGELTVFCGALFGAAMGFLWHNAHPAEVFMGDVGSLGLGGALGTLAVISKHEIVLALVGGIFVMEALSVMLQVASFKLTGKRIFRMAPIHHHFELLGWAETKVVVRFWIVGVLLALLSLATLKVR